MRLCSQNHIYVISTVNIEKYVSQAAAPLRSYTIWTSAGCSSHKILCICSGKKSSACLSDAFYHSSDSFFWCLSMTDFIRRAQSSHQLRLFLSEDGDTFGSPAVWQKISCLRPGIFGTCGTCGGGCKLSRRIPLQGGAWDPTKELFWCHIFNCLHLHLTPSLFLRSVIVIPPSFFGHTINNLQMQYC